MRRGGVLLALWVVVAFTAIGVGTWALSLVGGEINDRAAAPLSSADIDRELNADRVGQGGAQPSDPSPTGTAGRAGQDTTPTGTSRGLSTDGGTVRATCRGTSAYLTTWSPAPGYRSDDVQRGPAPTASVVFESDVKADLVVTAHCVDGVPAMNVTTRPDDHRGGRHGDDGGGSATTAGGTPTSGGGGSGGGTSGGGTSGGGTSGGSGSGGSGGTSTPTPSPTDDHGGHGSDDPPGDRHGGRSG